jgi:hypothetical protein
MPLWDDAGTPAEQKTFRAAVSSRVAAQDVSDDMLCKTRLFQQVAGFGEYCGGEGRKLLPQPDNDIMFTQTQLSNAHSLGV